MTTATDQVPTKETTRYAKTMFHVGNVGDFTVSRKTLDRMVDRFQQLRRMGQVLPVRLGHHPGSDEHPVPRADFLRLAKSDRRVQGFVSDLRLTADGQALHTDVTFVRKRGREAAKVNRMGLSPVFPRGICGPDGVIVGEVGCIDLADNPVDKSQGPFRPVVRMQLMRDTIPTPKTKGPRRMATENEIKLPDLDELQIATLKVVGRTLLTTEPLASDAFARVIELLWPDSKPEICQGFERDPGSLQETNPEFAAMSLDLHGRDRRPRLYEDASRETRIAAGDPEMDEARKFVDEQATRLHDIRR